MDEQNKTNSGSVPKQANQAEDKNQAIILTNLEDLILSHIASIEKTGVTFGEQKDTLDNIFLNDPTYKEHLDKAKDAAKIKNATRGEIIKRPEVAHVNESIKTMSRDLKDLKQELSEYLREYQRMSGANQIQDKNGDIREIVLTAKLIKRSTR